MKEKLDEILPNLLGLTDVSRELGWSKQQIGVYRTRGDFPKPIGEIGRRPVWWKPDIQEWRRKRVMEKAIKEVVKGMYLDGYAGTDEWFLVTEKELKESQEKHLREYETGEREVLSGVFYQTRSDEYRTGWFQDSDSGCWIRVVDGRTSGSWREDEPEWEDYLAKIGGRKNERI